MSETKKIKFAVIGQGHIGKRHAEMVRRNPSCELIAVCDILPKEKLGLETLKENKSSKATRHKDISMEEKRITI